MLKSILKGLRGFSLTFAVLCAVCAVAWAADKLIVTEREAAIRRDKKTWSPKVALVKEGDQVTLISTEEPWLRVEFKGTEGWINQSSVTADRNVVLSGTEAARGARATMQSEAGRGFTPEVEREYRKSKPDLDQAFAFLDKLEKQKVPDEKLLEFLKAGKLADFAAAGTAGGGK